ncbi:SPRY domain-containing protein 7-like [Mya arenaria]|uniref:SPRY domain-containing protein 7-like n=1 Tax=Mya arenaria TaxID=6604 RepID=UPI0022E831BE|nr:SPRY domain-containing protein 7-like [Mya arenaria]
MADVFCCLRRLFGSSNPGHITLQEIPSVQLDTSNMGSEVVIVKSGKRICGTGAAFSNAPINQDKAYFEIKVQSSGVWGVGLATRKCGVDKLPLGDTEESWVLRHDGKLYHNGEERGKMPQPLQEGDVVGLTYDHVELNFRLNDKPTNTPFTGIKGTVYPVFYVDDGATLDVQFTNFYNTPPFGYDSIMIEQSLL